MIKVKPYSKKVRRYSKVRVDMTPEDFRLVAEALVVAGRLDPRPTKAADFKYLSLHWYGL